VKPNNFLIGISDDINTIYIIDFGLAKLYKNPHKKKHIPYKDKKNLTGTARFASLNTHLGIEQSRRDDLECLGYILVNSLKGSLSWQDLQAKDRKEKYEKIKCKKQEITIDKLCESLPVEFGTYLKYCRKLKFDETPKYDYIKKLFTSLFESNGFTMTLSFDWVLLEGWEKYIIKYIQEGYLTL